MINNDHNELRKIPSPGKAKSGGVATSLDIGEVLAMGLSEFGKSVVTTGANFESLRARLKTIEEDGSAEEIAESEQEDG